MATTISAGRGGYHHGDLRNALIAAAVDLASEGGPERVVLREAARRVGVSPTAAYRHFDGQAELLRAVKLRGQEALSDFMGEALREVPGAEDPGEAAVQRLAALGRGYVRFAVESPGLFRTAFCHISGESAESHSWAGVTRGGPEPEYRAFNQLSGVLDELVETGRMPASNRPAAEAVAWSAVHGFSVLILDGPFARLSETERNGVFERALASLVAGLTAPWPPR